MASVILTTKDNVATPLRRIMKREADAGAMTGSGGPTSPHKRYRQGDDELRLLIPSKQVQRRESRRITRKGEVSRGESETQLARIGRVRDAMSMLYVQDGQQKKILW
ncbi:hypothetical protein HZH68_007341 [Vespula germanica]|uniref:Uncharacterized protein n=1 Tax=Vespula germanica TaxID=30212 RepID=A0A834KCU7_VESGE|nr:hypothetical protein HZH68_007341 [Vespula germanica]